MLILPMLFEPFQQPKPEYRSSGGTHLMMATGRSFHAL
jgi:hypothetical protein